MKSTRTILSIALLLLSMTGLNAARPQDPPLDVKRINSDSLVSFLRKEYNETIYFRKDEKDVSTFTISENKGAFMEKALNELREMGYTVYLYNGEYFIYRGRLIYSTLPYDYFAKAVETETLLEDESTLATFQNKIYEIGDRKEGRTGKAFVHGYVRDAVSGEPILGAAVHTPDGSAYAVTDAYGFYRLQLPVGDNVLKFNGYSLEELELNLKVNDDGGLDVTMKEMITTLTGAVVSAEGVSHHRDSRMGIEKVRMNTIRKIPTAFGEADVLKAVLTLPGVKTVGEASSGYNVRGGSVDQNLILMNDGTIFNPSHMFGIFSAFNPDIVSEMELYKSSIPAEFGGRISSVLDVRSKEGNSKKISGTLGLGLLTSSFSLEGPIIKDKTTFVLGGRTTYSDWMLGLLPENSGYSGGSASFYDVNFGLSHKFNEKNDIHANVYASSDRFSFSSDTTFHYSNFNASLKLRSQLSGNLTMSAVTGVDSYGNILDDHTFGNGAYTMNTDVNQAYGKLIFSHQVGDHHKFGYGAQGIYYLMNPGTMTPYGEESTVVPVTLDQETAIEASLFLSDSWTPGSGKLAFEYGTRMNMFLVPSGTKYPSADLRLSGKYSFRDNFSFKAGLNTMHQNIHMITNSASISPMDTWKLSDDRIRPQSGWQAASGLYWTIADNKLDLSVEGYWKEMEHYLDYKSGAQLSMNPNLADDLVETQGKAYGVEVMARKNIGKLNGWISYTWARTFLRETEDRGADTINGGDWYRAAHDKPHDFKMVGNYKFTHRYSMSVNIDYSTGRPVTIPIAKYWYEGGWRLAYSERNGRRIPDYFRMDLAFNVDPSHYLKQLTHMTVTFGVYNVTGRKNAYSIFYTSSGGGTNINGYKISVFATQIPYINLNMKF